jgi:hypothetical protein
MRVRVVYVIIYVTASADPEVFGQGAHTGAPDVIGQSVPPRRYADT